MMTFTSIALIVGTTTGSLWLAAFGILLLLTLIVFGVRFIPNDRVGIIEKLWSLKGSVGEGRIIASGGQAGYEPNLLRGGIHFGKWVWQYRIHKAPLVTIPQGKIGYIYARDGEPLSPGQTLARVVECSNFQDADGFLDGRAARPGEQITVGQRGRQRAILREGVYAIEIALVKLREAPGLSLRRLNEFAFCFELFRTQHRIVFHSIVAP